MTSLSRSLPVLLFVAGVATAAAQDLPSGASGSEGLDPARYAFYSGRYDEAARMAADARQQDPGSLESYEIRTSALLFALKRELGDDVQQEQKKIEECSRCPALLEAFGSETVEGQGLLRRRIASDPDDARGHYVLAKLDLNYLWLHNGILGKRTGWSEYREARRSLETVLGSNPEHLRAQVAAAWIDYIVATRMPWGTKWLFGGGNRTRALEAMRAATTANGDFYDTVEARFGLWEMLVREKNHTEASVIARELVRDFPENPVLTAFVKQHGEVVSSLPRSR
ncbi:MAG: tetratricopeptide repeat protein [Vicinamibacterales bacterium]